MGLNSKDLAIEIFYSAIKAVDPYNAVKPYTNKILSIYQKERLKKLIVIGIGKAACNMARAIEDDLSDLIDSGIVITKYGHCEAQKSGIKAQGSKIEIFEAGHPIPDKNGLKGTEKIIKLLKGADENTLVVCLISGGGSALLVSPYEGISLVEKQKVTQLLLSAGANIYELNTVRKHISRVKGGRLAEIAYPGKILSLILSDVIGDRLNVIASGPTAPDDTTFNEALEVLKKYNLIDKTPKKVIEILQKGVKGLRGETPKRDSTIFDNVENIIIGSNRKALEAAKKKAESFGLKTEIISSEITGEAREVGGWLADIARSKRSNCLISGGETTVFIKGNGAGGRNMELALSFAIKIEGINGITLLSAGTDGTDGPTDAAGAIVDGKTVKEAKAIGLDPIKYLNNNDSYNFFKKINALFVTGPTGTNVMDIQIIILNKGG